MKPVVLVVDDEDTIRNLLKTRLSREGWEICVASNAQEAEHVIGAKDVGVMITDLKMPGKDGLALMAACKGKSSHTRVIMITGHGDKEVAVKALRQGASDYLEKPFDTDELCHTVKRCLREAQLEKDNQDLVGRLEARVQRVEGKSEDKYWYVSKASSMAKVNEWMTVLRREAMRDAEEPSVLILGESGTGKEGIARMVHAGSRRGKGPWVAVNCANFNEQLLESELFGHEKGAFTGAQTLKRGLFEIARGGTLFLDEIGEMDPKLQAKLLRVLQEKSFRRVGGTQDMETDVRVVAATNQNLQARVRDGKFRDDLYHRMNKVVIELPALRDRIEDVVPMAQQFAERAFRSRGKNFSGFSPESKSWLEGYGWPGNVRELMNVIERCALVWHSTGPITPKDLGSGTAGSNGASNGSRKLELVSNSGASSAEVASVGYTELKRKWSESFEREFLIASLARHGGNVSAAAR
ncbi:MAG TPA: sigma-54 dependent transcriptional regulator, partial [Bdellovibrionota bacterium]|nr:sigma-54 dependent transcriptional regulator [Bdellovibrionota bacterium]